MVWGGGAFLYVVVGDGVGWRGLLVCGGRGWCVVEGIDVGGLGQGIKDCRRRWVLTATNRPNKQTAQTNKQTNKQINK